MPNTKVISIDVDDTKFRNFYGLFEQYSNRLEKTDGDWKKASEALGHAFGNTDELKRASDLVAGTSTAALGLARIFTGSLGVAVKGIVGGFKLMSSTIHAVLRDARRLAEVGGIIVAGFDRLSVAAVNRTNAALALSSSSGRVSAFGAAAHATGLASPNLPAQLQAAIAQDPGRAALVAQRLGMTPNQMFLHPIAASEALMQLTHNLNVPGQIRAGQLPRVIEEMPTMKFLSEAGIGLHQQELLGNASQARLNSFNHFVGTQSGRFQIDQGAALEMQKFRMDLGAAGLAIETDLINRLRTLGPSLGSVLTRLTGAFITLLNSALSPQNIQMIRSGLEDFAKFMSGGAFKSDLAKFSGAILEAGTVIRGAVAWLKANLPQMQSDVHAIEHPVSTVEHAAQHELEHVDAEIANKVRRLMGQPSAADKLAGDYAQLHPAAMIRQINSASELQGLAPGVGLATASAESGLNPLAQNPNSSAKGVFQLVGSMRQSLGVKDWANASQNINAGTKLLRDSKSLALQLDPSASGKDLSDMTYAIFHLGAPAFSRTWAEMKLVGSAKAGAWQHSWLLPGETRKALGSFDVSMANLAMLRQADPHASAQQVRRVADMRRRLSSQDLASIIHPGAVSQQAAAAASGVQLADSSTSSHLKSIDRKLSKGVPIQITIYTPVAARLASQTNGVQ